MGGMKASYEPLLKHPRPGPLSARPLCPPCPNSDEGPEDSLVVLVSSVPRGFLDDKHLGQRLFGALKDGLWTQILMLFQVSVLSSGSICSRGSSSNRAPLFCPQSGGHFAGPMFPLCALCLWLLLRPEALRTRRALPPFLICPGTGLAEGSGDTAEDRI